MPAIDWRKSDRVELYEPRQRCLLTTDTITMYYPRSRSVWRPACSSVWLLTSVIFRSRSRRTLQCFFQQSDDSGEQRQTTFLSLSGLISNAVTVTGLLCVRRRNLALAWITQAGVYGRLKADRCIDRHRSRWNLNLPLVRDFEACIESRLEFHNFPS